jgi:hypothetical protein
MKIKIKASASGSEGQARPGLTQLDAASRSRNDGSIAGHSTVHMEASRAGIGGHRQSAHGSNQVEQSVLVHAASQPSSHPSIHPSIHRLCPSFPFSRARGRERERERARKGKAHCSPAWGSAFPPPLVDPPSCRSASEVSIARGNQYWWTRTAACYGFRYYYCGLLRAYIRIATKPRGECRPGVSH